MDKKRVIIEVDESLLFGLKLWTITNHTTIAEVGRALFVALNRDDPRALAIVRDASKPKKGRGDKGADGSWH